MKDVTGKVRVSLADRLCQLTESRATWVMLMLAAALWLAIGQQWFWTTVFAAYAWTLWPNDNGLRGTIKSCWRKLCRKPGG